ncbi:MAG: malectin domain-containing carbohydrate-binding protein, partial [Calditrichota bacterium]
IAWSVNGYEVFRQTEPHIEQIIHAKQLMMNIWQPNFPSWVGNFDPMILPVYAYYDWIKYYQWTPGVNSNFTLQWSDNLSVYNQNRWLIMDNHTWENNNSDLIFENAVFQNGYLILCLTNETNLGYSGAPIIDTDIVAPYPIYARSYDETITIAFSEVLDQSSAKNTANYNVPPLTVTGATLQSDQKLVVLDVPGLDNSLSYNLIMTNIADPAGNAESVDIIQTEKPLPFPINITVGSENAAGNYLGDFIWRHTTNRGHIGGDTFQHSGSQQFDNTDDDEVYQSEQRDIRHYQTNLANGVYDITLMTAETEFTSPSARIFNVIAEEELRISNYSIYAEAGLRQFYAIEKVIDNVEVRDGVLDLYFESIIGTPVLSGIRIERVSTGLGSSSERLPIDFDLQVYPNPFNPATSIAYTVDEPSDIELKLYNLRGQKVKDFGSDRKSTGRHTQKLSANGLAAGIYFLQLTVNRHHQDIKKIVLIK